MARSTNQAATPCAGSGFVLAFRLALILANGELGDLDVARARLAQRAPDVVIAADGGAGYASLLGLQLDALVGDLDSATPEESTRLTESGTELMRRPREKDETDLELALLYAFGRGAEEAIVLGAAGGRIDMTLANVLLLLHPALAGRRIRLWVGRQTAYLLRPPGGEIDGAAGDAVSLIPLQGDAQGVTTHGLAFSLAAETLGSGPARGVSNRIAGPDPSVELTSGALLVVHTPQDELPGSSRLPGTSRGGPP